MQTAGRTVGPKRAISVPFFLVIAASPKRSGGIVRRIDSNNKKDTRGDTSVLRFRST